jgi:hypothetical protein
MDKEELKVIIQNLPDNSPKLIEYLQEAKAKGWTDIIDLIAVKLGLKPKEEKKGKRKESEILKKVLKPLGKKRIEHTWDDSVDFLEAKKVLTDAYKQLYDMNLMPYEAYVAILLIQLVNGARIGEAIRAFKTFVETGQREFQLQAEKRGNMKFFIIPSIIKNRPSYRFVLTIPDYDLKARIRMFTRKYLKCTTHSLRYALVSFLSKNGTDPAIIAKITGHKKLDRIVQYTQLKDAVEIQRKLAS